MSQDWAGRAPERGQASSPRGTAQAAPGGGDTVLGDAQNWAARSHRELYDSVHHGNDPAQVGELAREWNQLGREFGVAAQRLSERLRGTESGWQGDAAQAARAAIQKLVDWNRTAGEAASALGDRVASQSRIMEFAKAEMPEPVKVSGDLGKVAEQTYASGDLAAFTRASSDLRVQQDKANSAHERAVEVMTRMEEQSRGVDRDTPKFTAPPNPLQEQAAQVKGKSVDPAGGSGGQQVAGGNGAGPGQQPPSGQTGAPPPGDQQHGPQQPPGGPPQQNQSQSVQPDGGQPQPPKLSETTGPNGEQVAGTLGGGPIAANTGGSGGGASSQSGGDSSQQQGKDQPDSPDDDGAQPPRLEDFKPDGTSSQSAVTGLGGTPNPTPGGGQETFHQPRTMQGPDGSTIGGQPVTPQCKGSGSGGSRTGWSGQVPPLSSSGGGSGSGGGSAAGGPGSGTLPAPGGSASIGRNPGPAGEEATGGGGAGGASAGTGMGGMGAMPPAGAAAGQGRGQDEERSAKYVEGGPVAEVPGADLPPPVIGEGKRQRQQQQEPG